MADEPQDTPQDEPAPDQPAAEQPAAEEPEATPEQPEATPEQPEADASEEAPAEETPSPESGEQPQAEADAPAEAEEAPAEKPKPKRKKEAKADEPEVIPGAHLEPDLVLEDDSSSSEEPAYAGVEAVVEGESEETPVAEGDDEDAPPQPLEAVLNLAADARYRATGKRKSAVARVTLKPGTGKYTINGRTLDEYFPRATLQTKARLPLETVGQQERMDVVAKIHGGGVSAQAGALRHGITKALVEADPNLRGELKRRGFLTRDPRVKERKKAGFKKARKRPQFSKR
jgi:small subunit ribosomal protein S9